MALKDYYEILELAPGASDTSIKKSFRKLAMRYHPDRNVGNPYAIHHFREIKEAYEVLSNPVKRSEYHRKRWQHPFMEMPGNGQRQVSPDLLLREALQIERYVATLDIFRMNHEALEKLLHQLLNEHHLKTLEETADSATNRRIIVSVLAAIRPLPYTYLSALAAKMVRVAAADNDLIRNIHREIQAKKRQYLWDKYKGFIMLLIALLLCYFIYKSA